MLNLTASGLGAGVVRESGGSLARGKLWVGARLPVEVTLGHLAVPPKLAPHASCWMGRAGLVGQGGLKPQSP